MQGAATTPAGKKAASVAAELFTVFGRVVLFFVKFVTAIIGFSLIFAAIGVFIGMIAALFHPASIFFNEMDLPVLLDGIRVISPLIFIELTLLCTLVPLFVMGMALLSFTFGWRLGGAFYGVTLGMWAVAIIFLGVVCASNVRFFRDEVPDRIERFEHWSDDEWERREVRHRVRNAGKIMRDADGVNIDLNRDSLVIVIKKDGTPNDTIPLSPEGRVAIPATDSVAAIEPVREEGRVRVDIRLEK